MDVQIFWSMIEDAQRENDGIFEIQHELLIAALSLLSVEEIQEFDRVFWTSKARSLRTDIWEAVSIIACGCSRYKYMVR